MVCLNATTSEPVRIRERLCRLARVSMVYLTTLLACLANQSCMAMQGIAACLIVPSLAMLGAEEVEGRASTEEAVTHDSSTRLFRLRVSPAMDRPVAVYHRLLGAGPSSLRIPFHHPPHPLSTSSLGAGLYLRC